MRCISWFLALTVPVAALAAQAQPQTQQLGTVQGVVIDSIRRPLQGVEVLDLARPGSSR